MQTAMSLWAVFTFDLVTLRALSHLKTIRAFFLSGKGSDGFFISTNARLYRTFWFYIAVHLFGSTLKPDFTG